MRRRIFVLFLLSLAAPLIVIADIRITEIMYDPAGVDTKREWIEIYNAGSVSVDLSKYKFTDKSNHALNAPPKNGGVGSITLTAGSYAVLASDGTTFSGEYSGLGTVIDTVMSLNNTGATISLLIGTTVADTATYAKAQGASGTGDSLQLHNGAWIHARPTPGAQNATEPSVRTVAKPKAVPAAKSTSGKKPAVAVEKANAEELNDPNRVVNATPTQVIAQTAAAGSLGGSLWWLIAAALAIGTGAVVSLISHSKKLEWDIEESE